MEPSENKGSEAAPLSIESAAPPGLSTKGTVLSFGVIVAALMFGVWILWSSPRLDSVENPEAALSLIVGRMMELRDSLSEGSSWERQLHSLLLISTPSEVPLAMSWFEELVTRSQETLPSVELAILEGESGLIQKVADRLVEWKVLGGDFPAFAKLMEIGYVNPQDSGNETGHVDLNLLDQLESRWFRDRLMTRLSMAGVLSGNGVLNASSNTLASARVYAGTILLLTVAGLVSLPWVLVRLKAGAGEAAIGGAQIPPEWNGRTVVAMILRIAAFVVLFVIGVGVSIPAIFVNTPLLLGGMSLFGTIILSKLSRRYLLDESNGKFVDAFGVSVAPGTWKEMVSWVAVLTAAGIVGDLAIIWFGDWLGISVHWTEWFDEDLVWGHSLDLSLLFLAAIVLAPVFEELFFRGLVFRALRLKFSFGIAAGSSAVLFSVLHGYSIVGFFAVMWSGFLWAWSFERTKTLLPAIIAHGINNLLMVLGLALFLRA
jgi:membrane protease YdiL (CAAX protease family)